MHRHLARRFLGRCGEVALDDNGLWLDRIAYDGEHRVFIPSPGRTHLAEAIREPAEAVGLHIAPALVQRMVSELAGEPGALPLLSHVLICCGRSGGAASCRKKPAPHSAGWPGP